MYNTDININTVRIKLQHMKFLIKLMEIIL